MNEEQRKNTIKALIRERQVYEKRDQPERVEEVDKQLRHLGHEGQPPQERAESRPAQSPQTTQRKKPGPKPKGFRKPSQGLVGDTGPETSTPYQKPSDSSDEVK